MTDDGYPAEPRRDRLAGGDAANAGVAEVAGAGRPAQFEVAVGDEGEPARVRATGDIDVAVVD